MRKFVYMEVVRGYFRLTFPEGLSLKKTSAEVRGACVRNRMPSVLTEARLVRDVQ